MTFIVVCMTNVHARIALSFKQIDYDSSGICNGAILLDKLLIWIN